MLACILLLGAVASVRMVSVAEGLGLTTWYMGAATEIWGGTPDVCTQGTVTTSQLQFTVAVVSDYSCLTVRVQGYGMSPKIVIT